MKRRRIFIAHFRVFSGDYLVGPRNSDLDSSQLPLCDRVTWKICAAGGGYTCQHSDVELLLITLGLNSALKV